MLITTITTVSATSEQTSNLTTTTTVHTDNNFSDNNNIVKEDTINKKNIIKSNETNIEDKSTKSTSNTVKKSMILTSNKNDTTISTSKENDLKSESLTPLKSIKTIKQSTEVTVNSYDDLYNAVETAKSSNENNYVINLDTGNYVVTKTIYWGNAAGALRNLTINGNSQIIYGNGHNTFMNVSSNYILNINNITIRNINQSNVGAAAINSSGNVHINNSYFINNTGIYGGAIYSNCSLDINNSQFINNTGFYGAAIYQIYNGTNITNTSFESNHACSVGIRYDPASARGGAIFLAASKNNIVNCTFIKNNSTGAAGAIQSDQNCELNIINSTFKNCTSHGWNGANYLAYGNYTIINSTFEGNYGPSHGGAIGFLISNVTIENCTFNKNYINETAGEIIGGALFFDVCNAKILNSTITNCNASYGGGIGMGYSNITVNNTIMYNNSAVGGGAIVGYHGPSNCEVNNVTFTNNTARKWGGSIFLFYGINLTVSNSSFHNDTASIGAAICSYQGNYLKNNVTISENYFDNEKALNETLNLPNLTRSLVENNIFLNCSIGFNKFNITTANTAVTIGDNAVIDIIEQLTYPEYYDADIFDKTNYTVFVNDDLYSHTANGVNKYTITINKDGDNTYILPSIASNVVSNVLVFKADKINTIVTSNSVSTNAYDPVEIKVDVTDINGNPINEGIVFFYDENNILLGNSTVINGKASITLTYNNEGKYPVIIRYNGTDKYNKNTTDITVTVYNFVITPSTENINTITYDNVTSTAIITNTNGDLINSGTAYYYDNNNQLIGSSPIIDGKIKITLSYDNSGIYPITIKYKDSSTVFNIIVNKRNTTVTLPEYKDIVTNKINLKANVTDISGNTVVNQGTVYFYLNGTLIAQADVINGSSTTNVSINQTGNYIIKAIYNGTNSYNSNSTTNNIEIEKLNTNITVEPIKGKYNEVIYLNATILDQNGNNVMDGKVVFKINGQVINDTNGNPIYVNVVNGKAVASLTAPVTWLHDNEKITAVYSGSTKYNSSRSNSSSVNISKRNLNITLVTSPTSTADKTVLFVAIIHDENGKAIDGGKVVFKINDITIKDLNGNPRYIDLNQGLAQIDYLIPDGTSAHNYTITTKYSKKGYNSAVATGIQEIVKINTTIKFNNVIQNKSNLIINATIQDINGHNVIGTNKISVKVNGKTLRNSTNGTIFYINNGKINLDLTQYNQMNTNEKITIVTGGRLAYTETRNSINI